MIILDIQRVSVASDGTQANNGSAATTISANGRYVAFMSFASNLVSGDTNNAVDVFVHDRQTGQTTRVSVASDGTQGNGNSTQAAISADGRFVAFSSTASTLVSGDTNSRQDVFVHDRQTGQTTRVSVASDGTQGNGNSTQAAISADGRFVAFESSASNLVSDDTNGIDDVFVHDRQTGQTARVSVASDGTQGNVNAIRAAISTDGRYVAFESGASNLVSGDTNNAFDVFVHDRQTGQTTRVSVASDGTQGNDVSSKSTISANGRYVAFESGATNLVSGDTNNANDIFMHDRQTGQTTRISLASNGAQANAVSATAAISADGRYVAFESFATNLVSGDTNDASDVFVHDRQTGQTNRISVALGDAQGNDISWRPDISADGRFVVFESLATNLVDGDTNASLDIFVASLLEIVPAVIGVLPPSGSSGVERTFAINTIFSESVNFSAASFTLTCNSVPRTFSLNSSPNRIVILTPTIQLPANATCTVTAIADAITAVSDSDKPLANVSFSFSTAAPTGKLETIGIFRPSDSTFYLRNSNTTGPADFSILFGDSSDLPVAGDWNGDGIATIGIYRPSTGEFFLKDANTFGAPVVYNFTLGNPGDVPFAGDWDGDGKDSVGVYRPTNGVIFMKDTLSTGFADYAMIFGIAGDQPLAGDWNADGADSVGIYRGDEFFLTDTTCNGCIPTADYNFVLGLSGDVPFAGDWNANGSSGVGVFRPTDGVTFFKNALTTGFADIEIVYGIAGDKPIAGVWGAAPPPDAPSAPEIAPTFVPRQ
ncbi:hypothetical protein FBQ95_04595 [Chloroflexi bacterium CFX3]|nr:hypothetical protein [Chloroflexi bacterium CFX3]